MRRPGGPWTWLGPLLVFAIELPVIWTYPHVGEWFTFWYAGHVVATGGSLYDAASWLSAFRDYGPVAHGVAINTGDGHDPAMAIVEGGWIWPPIGGLLLAPFGALPLEIGIPLLHATTIAVAVASTYGLVRILTSASLRPIALAVLLASPSLVQIMRAASLTVVVLPAILLLFASLGAGGIRLGLAGVGLSIRPQVFLLTAPAVMAVSVRRGRRAVLVAVLTWSAISLASFLLAPVPLDIRLLQEARALAAQDNSSTWRLASLIAGDAAFAVAIALIAAAVILAAVAVRRAQADMGERTLVACALAVAVAAVPYTHTYDHLVLFPAWLLALRNATDAAGRIAPLRAAGVVVAALGYAWSAYLVGAAGTRAAIAVTPYLALALLAIGPRRAMPRGEPRLAA